MVRQLSPEANSFFRIIKQWFSRQWVNKLSCLTLLIAVVAPVELFAAGPYDPDVEYLSIETPRFEVVAPTGYENLAVRAGKIAEKALADMEERYGYKLSGRTTIVVNDQTDYANGSARIYPSKVITIYVTAPTEVSGLEDYDDWLQAVIVHELSHILHLDMVFGLPWIGRLLFGKWVAMNQYFAAWFTEGLAVYEETMSSGSGRGRSSLVEMFIRTAALSDSFPHIDQAFRSFSNWPFANVAYFFGGRFQQYLAAKYGEEKLMKFHRAYASNPIPYISWLASYLAFGSTLETEWEEFRLEMTSTATLTAANLAKSSLPLSQPKRITNYGGQVLGPQFTPDGSSLVFSTSSLVDGPRVRLLNLRTLDEEVLLEDTLSKAISLTSDGQSFFFQQTHINQRFYSHNSILRYDFGSNSSRRLEPGPTHKKEFLAPSGLMRGRDPDVSKDGKRIVFVQTPYGSNRLVLAWLESDGTTLNPKVIVPAQPDVQFSNPRFSPNGEEIVVSRFRGGRRDIIIYNLQGNIVEKVTSDRALDIDPCWSNDGQWIVFSSDRTGIYNLYAYERETKSFRQLTNLLTGAFQPNLSPNSDTLVFRGYTKDGFDVFMMNYSFEDAPKVSFHPEPEIEFDNRVRQGPPLRKDVVKRPPPPASYRTSRDSLALPDGWALKPYSAVTTLLPFNDNWNVLPSLFFTENNVVGQVSHFSTDAMQTQSYLLWATYEQASNFVGGGATYVNDQLFPTFSLSARRSVRTYSLFDQTDGFLGRFFEQIHLARFGTTVPVRQRHALGFSFSFEERTSLASNSTSFSKYPDSLPALGNYGRVRMGYTYQNLRGFPHSISRERGWSAALSFDALSRALGSDYEQFMLHAEIRGYWSLPYSPSWLKNHVLATRVAVGISGGPDLADSFRLGGVGGQSAISTTTQNFFPLRGLRIASQNGPGLLTGTLEYRAPIVRIERGLATIPIVFRVIHAAFFADYGQVLSTEELQNLSLADVKGGNMSVGAEIRSDILLFWALNLRLRAGYAHLLRTSNTLLDDSGFFFQIGSTF